MSAQNDRKRQSPRSLLIHVVYSSKHQTAPCLGFQCRERMYRMNPRRASAGQDGRKRRLAHPRLSLSLSLSIPHLAHLFWYRLPCPSDAPWLRLGLLEALHPSSRPSPFPSNFSRILSPGPALSQGLVCRGPGQGSKEEAAGSISCWTWAIYRLELAKLESKSLSSPEESKALAFSSQGANRRA